MRAKLLKTFIMGIVAVGICGFCDAAESWRVVSSSRDINFSGMALLETSDKGSSFVVVMDNKKPTQDRIGILSATEGTATTATYRKLEWPTGNLPIDLESVAAGLEPRVFYTLASAGTLYSVKLDENCANLSVTGTWEIPNVTGIKNPNYESFAARRLGEKTLAVWAHRGKDADPAILCWSTFNASAPNPFENISTTTISVKWPTQSEVRHIADAKVDTSGTLYIASAQDPGDYGPFASAIYRAGSFSVTSEEIKFNKLSDMELQFKFTANKAEALELLPKGGGELEFAAGSDDEGLGAAYWSSAARR